MGPTEAIVWALSEKAPVWQEGFFGDDEECTLCGAGVSGAPAKTYDGKEWPGATWLQDPSHHNPRCPWRLAKEWVSRQTDDKGE